MYDVCMSLDIRISRQATWKFELWSSRIANTIGLVGMDFIQLYLQTKYS